MTGKPSNCSEYSLALFVRCFCFGVLFWLLINVLFLTLYLVFSDLIASEPPWWTHRSCSGSGSRLGTNTSGTCHLANSRRWGIGLRWKWSFTASQDWPCVKHPGKMEKQMGRNGPRPEWPKHGTEMEKCTPKWDFGQIFAHFGGHFSASGHFPFSFPIFALGRFPFCQWPTIARIGVSALLMKFACLLQMPYHSSSQLWGVQSLKGLFWKVFWCKVLRSDNLGTTMLRT